MKRRWHTRWRALALSLDLLFVGGVLVLWTIARFGSDAIGEVFVPATGRAFGRAPLAFAIPAWLAVFAALRLYNPERCQNALEEGRRLVMAGPAAAVTVVMLGFLVKENPARSWLVGAMILGSLSAAIGRQTMRSIVARFRSHGRWTTRTLVVGGPEGKRIVEILLTHRALGIEPIATCGFECPGLNACETDDIASAIGATKAEQILIVAEDLGRRQIATVIEVADELPVNVIVLPGLDYLMLGSLRLVTIGHEPGLAVDAPSLRPLQARVKRAIDICVGTSTLLLTSPVMLLCALAIKLDTPGPALFRQRREGRKGSVFEVVKFRTMRNGSDIRETADLPADLSFFSKSDQDPRTTRVGRLLRRSSLDELPQLWNVVKGDMSLVGPRPLALCEAERLGLRRRMVVRPGLTGLWQVSGRSKLSPEERIRLDLVYVQNWSLMLDLSILLRTLPAVVGGRGAY